MSVPPSWEVLCEGIERAEPGSDDFYKKIRAARDWAAREHARQRELIYAKEVMPDEQSDIRAVSDRQEATRQFVTGASDEALKGEVMAKGPKAPANTGKVPSKTGARHDANVTKTGKTNLGHQAKHAPKGGGKK